MSLPVPESQGTGGVHLTQRPLRSLEVSPSLTYFWGRSGVLASELSFSASSRRKGCTHGHCAAGAEPIVQAALQGVQLSPPSPDGVYLWPLHGLVSSWVAAPTPTAAAQGAAQACSRSCRHPCCACPRCALTARPSPPHALWTCPQGLLLSCHAHPAGHHHTRPSHDAVVQLISSTGCWVTLEQQPVDHATQHSPSCTSHTTLHGCRT